MGKRYRWNKKVFAENLLTLLVLIGAGVGLAYLFWLWAWTSIVEGVM